MTSLWITFLIGMILMLGGQAIGDIGIVRDGLFLRLVGGLFLLSGGFALIFAYGMVMVAGAKELEREDLEMEDEEPSSVEAPLRKLHLLANSTKRIGFILIVGFIYAGIATAQYNLLNRVDAFFLSEPRYDTNAELNLWFFVFGVGTAVVGALSKDTNN